jgi:hypothetical protein
LFICDSNRRLQKLTLVDFLKLNSGGSTGGSDPDLQYADQDPAFSVNTVPDPALNMNVDPDLGHTFNKNGSMSNQMLNFNEN